MIDWSDWLLWAGTGIEIISALIATSYVVSRLRDRLKAIVLSKPLPLFRDEKIVTAWDELVIPFLNRYLGWYLNFGKIVVRRTNWLGFLHIAILAPFALVYFLLFFVLVLLFLPVALVRQIIDSESDFRLRVIVLLFATGIGLQIAAVLAL